MAKKYRSKPHEIDAFRFSNKKRAYPQWFIDQMHLGKASVSDDNKHRYITVYGQDQVERAYTDDWICLSGHGKLYVLSNENFKQGYEHGV